MARIVGLFSYPVKGCAGVALREGGLGAAGLNHDRTFMVVDDGDGGFVSQRNAPRMAVVRPEIDDDGTRLMLTAPGAEAIEIKVDVNGARRDVRMHGAPFRGVDQGDPAAEWLSTVLGRPCRLVRVPPELDRVTSGETPGTAGFADSSAVLVMAERSVAELNARLADRGVAPLPMDRFRANFVVDGWEEPHVEDRVRRFEVGSAELGFTKLAVRCAVTTVDQRRGERVGPEPLRTLAEYRRISGGVALGVRFAVTRPGTVAVGDELRVTRWAEP